MGLTHSYTISHSHLSFHCMWGSVTVTLAKIVGFTHIYITTVRLTHIYAS